jgi:magnesium chelatase subunit I
MSESTSHLLRALYTANPARAILESKSADRGLADEVRFPFLGLVGQAELKLALILTLINRRVGGVLLIGPRGTGKTTAVRGLVDLMPEVERSICPNGCEPGGRTLGEDSICPDCLEKLNCGEDITQPDRMRLMELPLNARLEDVVGGINERIALEQHRIRLERGILSLADQNLLYIDEVNLLDDAVINAILDAAAQGIYTVRRGPLAATYRARLILVGSMNPEEGKLRPQLQDRFGLRLTIRGLREPEDRLEIYRRTLAYQTDPHGFVARWQPDTWDAVEEITAARARLPRVTFAPGAEHEGLRWIDELGIDSHRAEITLFEAARAHAAADGRAEATVADLTTVAPMALRHRRSEFMEAYFETQAKEEQEIQHLVNGKADTAPRVKR